MLADFTIVFHYDDKPDRAVRIAVHDNLKTLRSAATRYNRRSGDATESSNDILGVCHRFENELINENREWTIEPLCAIVRLAPPHLGIGIVSHELAHAAVWLRELTGETEPLTTHNDEDFCWILGELVRQTVDKFYKYGLY